LVGGVGLPPPFGGGLGPLIIRCGGRRPVVGCVIYPAEIPGGKHPCDHNLINVLEEKYKPKLLRLDVRRDLESWIGDVVLDYIRDDLELWEKRVEHSDLISAKEMMELWSK